MPVAVVGRSKRREALNGTARCRIRKTFLPEKLLGEEKRNGKRLSQIGGRGPPLQVEKRLDVGENSESTTTFRLMDRIPL